MDETKHVLVTGCDTGFGYFTVFELNKFRIQVFAGCLTQDYVKRLTDDPRFRRVAFLLDVTKEDDIEKAYDLVKDAVGEQGLKLFSKMKSSASTNFNKVTYKICHALLSARPKSRYLIGFKANTIFLLIAILPTSVGDYILRLLEHPVVPAAMKEKEEQTKHIL